MQLNIATRHGHISDRTQAKIRAKVEKLTRFHDRLSSAEITLDLANESRPKVEVQVTAAKAGKFVASDTSEQLMTALDSVVHKLEQQLRKHKEKITDRGHRVALGKTEELIPAEVEAE